jgi:hypothetical protein
LIFNSHRKSWKKPSSCIWALDKIQLPHKFSVGSEYSSLKSFFCDILGIKAPKVETYIQGLKDFANGAPSVPIIKETIGNICLLNPTRDQLRTLSDCACFPVNTPNGTLEWMDSKATFAIVDQNVYGKLFSGKINLLDFSLEDVHSFGIFLRGLDLQKQYLSGLVNAKTAATNSVLNGRLSDGLRKKAYAICRQVRHSSIRTNAIAYAFRYIVHHQKSPNQRTALQIFQILCSVDVYTTDVISKTLSVRQGHNDPVSVNSEISYLHIELVEDTEEEEKLRLHVPNSQKRYNMCMTAELPSRLLHMFSASQNAAAGILSILMNKELSVIDEILENAGIINVDGVNRAEEVDEADSSTIAETIEVIDEQSGLATLGRSTQHLQRQSLTERSEPLNRSDYFGHSISLTPSSSGVSLTPGTSIFDSPDTEELQSDLFERFLNAVVDGARSLPGVPMCDRFIVSNTNATTVAQDEIVRALAGDLRNNKIGAAGELCVSQTPVMCTEPLLLTTVGV